MNRQGVFPLLFLFSALFQWANLGAEPMPPEPGRLSYFRFNNDGWLGEKGEEPLQVINVTNVMSFDGGALQVNNTNGTDLLLYRDVEPNGMANIACQTGAIRFWYKPFWSSKDRFALPGYGWGNGPGQWVRLIEAGTWTADSSVGLFALSINPDGTNLVLQTQNHLGQSATNVIGRISFTFFQPDLSTSGPSWHEIGVTYSPERTTLRVDGTLIATGSGIAFGPPAEVLAQGFAVGSSTAGTMPAQGLIDELETFDYPIGEVENRMNDWVLSGRVTPNPPAIELDWRKQAAVLYTLRRRTDGSNDWSTLATNVGSLSYTDRTDIVTGRRYEYDLSGARLISGIDLPPVEQQGRILLLVDHTLAPVLAADLDQFKMDLIGDGWHVVRRDVPRHDDGDWAANPPKIAEIKSLILDEWRSANNDLKAILILGHVAIPYSGFFSSDGHPARPWPTDGYYGDVDGQWTDATNLAPSNLSQDGRFDQQSFPAPLRIAVGRVDFAQLPALYSGSVPAAESEADLLKHYLLKNHGYRHRQLSLPDRAIAGGFFNNAEDGAIYANALVNASRWFGFEPGKIFQGDLFLAQKPCLWGFAAGPGSPQVMWGENGIPHSTTELIDPAKEPPIAFYLLKGSFFGEWNIENNLMRAILATPTYGLAVMWTRFFRYRFEALAMGEPLGTGLLDTQNDPSQSDASPNLYLALLGDPTLRLQVTAPPSRLLWSGNNTHSQLTWDPSPELGAQYWIYRSEAGLDGVFTRLTADPIAENLFVDPEPPPGPNLYQVRSLRRVVTGSGSFTNLSQGVFALSIYDTNPPVASASVSPVPNAAGWNNTNATVTLTALDGPQSSGVASITASASGASTLATNTVPGDTASVVISTEGITTIGYFATDVAGNSSPLQTVTVSIDTLAPTLTWEPQTPAANGFDWNKSSVSLPWTAADATSGIASPATNGSVSFALEGTNQNQVVTVVDHAGNSASFTSPEVHIDLTRPTVVARTRPSLVLHNNNRGARAYVTVYGSVSDTLGVANSGVDTTPKIDRFSIVDSSGMPVPSGFFTVAANGTFLFTLSLSIANPNPTPRIYSITVRAKDKAGNTGSAVTTFTVR